MKNASKLPKMFVLLFLMMSYQYFSYSEPVSNLSYSETANCKVIELQKGRLCGAHALNNVLQQNLIPCNKFNDLKKPIRVIFEEVNRDVIPPPDKTEVYDWEQKDEDFSIEFMVYVILYTVGKCSQLSFDDLSDGYLKTNVYNTILNSGKKTIILKDSHYTALTEASDGKWCHIDSNPPDRGSVHSYTQNEMYDYLYKEKIFRTGVFYIIIDKITSNIPITSAEGQKNLEDHLRKNLLPVPKPSGGRSESSR